MGLCKYQIPDTSHPLSCPFMVVVKWFWFACFPKKKHSIFSDQQLNHSVFIRSLIRRDSRVLSNFIMFRCLVNSVFTLPSLCFASRFPPSMYVLGLRPLSPCTVLCCSCRLSAYSQHTSLSFLPRCCVFSPGRLVLHARKMRQTRGCRRLVSPPRPHPV